MDNKENTFIAVKLRGFPPNLLPYSILFVYLTFLPRLVLADGPAKCFFLDGTLAADHAPCVPASERSHGNHSSCCILGQPAGNDYDFCTTGGLCFAQHSSNSRGFLYQGGCTDSSLADGSCRQHCPPDTAGAFLMAA